MVQKQYSASLLFVYVLRFASFTLGFAESTKVVLLTTEGATTDLKWKVENWNAFPGFPGWEDMSMPYKDQVLRGYQICEINHVYNKDVKPETWLLLPKVNINGTSRVYVEMNFTMRECRDLQKTCRETFSVYYRTSKEWDSVPVKFHPKQYKKIDTVAAEVRFSPNINDTRLNHETVDISFENAPLNGHLYLHIAIVDVGACVALMGIRIYHKVCRETVAGFATFAETKTGVSDTSLVPIIGNCVPHSAMPLDAESFTINPLGPLYHCTSSGDWRVIKGMCECISGYEPGGNQSECVPCKKGMYKYLIGNNPCLPCHANSGTMQHGAISCHCDAEYSEIKNHKFGSSFGSCRKCSKLPGPPQRLNASVTGLDNPGIVTLSWRNPDDYGGCAKARYFIFCSHASFLSIVDATSKDDKSCSHVEFSPSSREVDGLHVLVKNLRGHSSYNFTVMAYTALSASRMSVDLYDKLFGNSAKGGSNQTDQVYSWWQNQELANFLYQSSAHILHQTSDTLPSSVGNLVTAMENETAIVVSWNRPAFPNGKILFYSVWYSPDYEEALNLPFMSNMSQTNLKASADHLWMNMKTNFTNVMLTDLSPGSTYQIFVTAHNSAGSDNGSAPLLVSTSPLTMKPPGLVDNPHALPYIIATIVVASLVAMVCVVLLLQWKCKPNEKKSENGNGEALAQFRPYNSQHDTLGLLLNICLFHFSSSPHTINIFLVVQNFNIAESNTFMLYILYWLERFRLTLFRSNVSTNRNQTEYI